MSNYYPENQKKAFRELKKLAKNQGIEIQIETEFGCRTIRATAPQGYIFANEQIHEFVDTVYAPWHPDYEDMLARVKFSPVKPCTDSLCEWCRSSEE